MMQNTTERLDKFS